ncbi:MAG: dienelactone hydrolase family protein [Phycisphaerales bacterium]
MMPSRRALLALALFLVLSHMVSCAGGSRAASNEQVTVETPDETRRRVPTGDILSRPLIYEVGGRRMLGRFVCYSDIVNGPVLVLLHDSWGIDEWLQSRADRYARMGYVVVMPDLVEASPEARDLSVSGNVQAAIDQVVRLTQLEGEPRQGVIGWGAGGSRAFICAMHMELDLVVIVDAPLQGSPESLLPVREPVLGLFGGLNPQTSVESIQEFQDALLRTGGRFEGQVWKDEGANFMRLPRDPANVSEADQEIVRWLDQFLPI